MSDPRHTKLAEILVQYSCELKEGDKVLIEAIEIPHTFTTELIRVVGEAGAQPFVTLKNQSVWRALQLAGSDEQMRLIAEIEAKRMSEMDAYIGLRGTDNVSEWSDIPTDKMGLYESTVWKKVHLDIRIPDTRWVVLRWPSPSMAQLAQMSTEAFENFYFDVCNLDYDRMSKAMQPLKELMDATDKVRLVAPGTDLSFSLKDIPAVCCDGHRNVPDGEVFTAPVRDSINGTIQYNTPTLYQGVTHEDILFEFKDGKIVAASSNQTEHLEKVLDTDDGSRYVGEFAIGFHPRILRPMKDILFDEKIAGSIHLTPGQAYKEAWNGNSSQIHWDLVLLMDPEAGGGEIWFDDKLIRKDGEFVIAELEGLNPDRLTA
ncbi:MAG: aminopeptidase [Thermoanaerobaculia bacterium]|jgi:aminopeptidase